MTTQAKTISRTRKKDHSEQIYGFIFAGIPILGFLVFDLIPMILSLIMSFANLPTYRMGDMQLYDFEHLFTNYAAIFNDEKFGLSIVNTLISLISLPISMFIGLILAVLLNNLKGAKIFRTIIFIPYVCSIVSISLMWRTMLNKQYGIINQFLGIFGVPEINWLGDPVAFRIAMVIMISWCNVGFSLILYSAALTAIDPTIYEAAEMGGSGKVHSFFHITLPLLSPTTFYLLVIGLIGGLQEFARYQAINIKSNIVSPTGPNDAGLTIVFYLYNKAFNEAGGLGQASAVAWVLTLAIILITAVNFSFRKRWVYDGD